MGTPAFYCLPGFSRCRKKHEADQCQEYESYPHLAEEMEGVNWGKIRWSRVGLSEHHLSCKFYFGPIRNPSSNAPYRI